MCSPVVKATLFRTFCSNMYCSQLWRDYRSGSIRQLIVGYNHSFRYIMNYPRNCSASGMFVFNDIPSFMAQQTANTNKIRWWSHIKRMAPTAPQSKALVIQPGGRRPRGRPRNRWEDDVPRWYGEMGISMIDVNNWVKERRPIVYPLDADGRRVRLK